MVSGLNSVTSNDLGRKSTAEDGAASAKSSSDRFLREENQRRLQELEKIHRENVKEKEDTIANLRDVICQHEKRLADLASKTDGNISAGKSRSADGAQSTPTLKLLDQIERLQKEKDALLRKVADFEDRRSRLQSGSYTPDEALLQHQDTSYQMGPCSTDTEKELEKMKRDKFFLDREIFRLREENVQLRNKLSSMGVDVSDVSSSRNPKLDDSFSYSSLSSSMDRSGDISHDKLGDSGFNDSVSISSLDSQILNLQHEFDHTSEELRLAESRQDDREVARLNDVIGKLHHVVLSVYQEFVELKKAYLALREEMNCAPASFSAVIAEMQQQVLKSLEEINIKYKELVEKYLREMKLRKKFHNELVELRGNIRVFCRIRPWIDEDGREEDDIVVTQDADDDALVTINNKGRIQLFDLDKVFGMDSTQIQVFDEVSALVRSVIDGYNVCIFAYGQTGSGKTHTMEGPRSDPGINQRALELLFEEANDSNWQYEISASVLEIYNEVIRDLLNPDPDNKLEVRMKPEGGLYVPGLVSTPVTSLDSINKVFETGRKNRATASTNMNAHSSRSHCLLCVTVTGYNPTTGSKSFGRLNLVDLAGSERVSKSHADGIHLKEAQNINRSLSCLGDVIHALRNKHAHVPFRNSKLTYLLQDSLGGDSKTLMIVQISPVEKNVSESVCTLTFGQRVRSVELGTASKNVDGKTTPTGSKRPPNLLISPQSPSSSPSPSPSASRRPLLSSSSSSPTLNSRKKPSTSSLNSPSTPSMRKSPTFPKSPSSPGISPKTSSTARKLPSTPKTPTSPLAASVGQTKNLSKSSTVPNLSGKVK